jgi:hypothetical protein
MLISNRIWIAMGHYPPFAAFGGVVLLGLVLLALFGTSTPLMIRFANIAWFGVFVHFCWQAGIVYKVAQVPELAGEWKYKVEFDKGVVCHGTCEIDQVETGYGFQWRVLGKRTRDNINEQRRLERRPSPLLWESDFAILIESDRFVFTDTIDHHDGTITRYYFDGRVAKLLGGGGERIDAKVCALSSTALDRGIVVMQRRTNSADDDLS